MESNVILFVLALASALFAAYNFNSMEAAESKFYRLSYSNSKSPELPVLKKRAKRNNILGGIAVVAAQTLLMVGIIKAISAGM